MYCHLHAMEENTDVSVRDRPEGTQLVPRPEVAAGPTEAAWPPRGPHARGRWCVLSLGGGLALCAA